LGIYLDCTHLLHHLAHSARLFDEQLAYYEQPSLGV